MESSDLRAVCEDPVASAGVADIVRRDDESALHFMASEKKFDLGTVIFFHFLVAARSPPSPRLQVALFPVSR